MGKKQRKTDKKTQNRSRGEDEEKAKLQVRMAAEEVLLENRQLNQRTDSNVIYDRKPRGVRGGDRMGESYHYKRVISINNRGGILKFHKKLHLVWYVLYFLLPLLFLAIILMQ